MGVCVWHGHVQDPFQDNVVAETEMFGGNPLWCRAALVMTTSLILWWLDTFDRTTLLTKIFSLLCAHISEHIILYICLV